jgi:hypothetical protein
MAFRANDRVKETTTTTGTGNMTLAGAVSGFQAFSVFANNDTVLYAIVNQSAAEWEVGLGTYVSATPAVARTTVFESSNADAAVNFSAGTKHVFVVASSHGPLLLKEKSSPGSTEANWMALYAADGGVGSELRQINEFNQVDVLTVRDRDRTQKRFYTVQGSDSGQATDLPNKHMGTQTVEGTLANVVVDADGTRRNFATAATNNADAGFFTTNIARRDLNPDCTTKFKVTSTAVRRVWIGWVTADHMASDSTAGTAKFALRLSTAPAVTGFTIVHSDGTTETVEAQIQASDAIVHTIRLIADAANNRFGYSFDGAAVVWITTNIPAATTGLLFQCEIRTLEAVAKNMDFWFTEGVIDK